MAFMPVHQEKVKQEHKAQGFTPCETENIALKHGEVLTHEVFYHWNFIWMGAGKTISTTRERGDNIHVNIVGNTYKSYDWFYKIRDYYETNLDKETLLPNSCLRNIQEGKYTLYDWVDFDQKNNKARSNRGKKKEIAITREYEVENCVHDVVSIIYFLRNTDFKSYKKGTTFPVNVFMDKEDWKVKLTYQGRENVTIKNKGKYKALKLKAEVSAGELFDEDSYITIWVSDDKNKIPLLVNLELSVGSIKVVLSKYQGVRHPIKSKIG